MSLVLNDRISTAAQEDLLDLEAKIEKFKAGGIDEERFKSFRLTRGVYGQRQLGVHMYRTKIPFGKLTGEQLLRLADVSEHFTNGNLHTTTRQNIQLHHVKLEDSPALWAQLEEVGVTSKEACGNTVRNVTASATAGIDPEELFDVAPYTQAIFEYFLRNPICQEMGRKVKIAFSSSDKDSAFAYFHDFGMIPRVRTENGEEVRGFKVLVGGGLGAQAFIAPVAYEFLPEGELIPFVEAAIRVFDRYGEREKRFKARMKFLIEDKKGMGLEQFMKLVEEERTALPQQKVSIDRNLVPQAEIPIVDTVPEVVIDDREKYDFWLKTNVFEQKQKGYFGVKIKLQLGDIHAETARKLVATIKGYVADDIRITVTQGLLLRFATKEVLPYLYDSLNKLGLASPGAETIADITACPGTDTCNLAVTNSTAISVELERMINEDFKPLVLDDDIQIKISGCMNSCGQHMAANIGFHGSSIKHGEMVVPALQVVIGGGVSPEGKGFIADKVIKLPSKKIPSALSVLLRDYQENSPENEYFNDYYTRQGKRYFYNLLKPFADLGALSPTDYIDWGHTESFVPEIGVGECAGVSFDVVGTIIADSEEKLANADKSLGQGRYADAIYYAYGAFVVGAKALLLSVDAHCNTHKGIMSDFDKLFVDTNKTNISGGLGFEDTVLKMKQQEPTEEFAGQYIASAKAFFEEVKKIRAAQLEQNGSEKDKLVIQNFYKA